MIHVVWHGHVYTVNQIPEDDIVCKQIPHLADKCGIPNMELRNVEKTACVVKTYASQGHTDVAVPRK